MLPVYPHRTAANKQGGRLVVTTMAKSKQKGRADSLRKQPINKRPPAVTAMAESKPHPFKGNGNSSRKQHTGQHIDDRNHNRLHSGPSPVISFGRCRRNFMAHRCLRGLSHQKGVFGPSGDGRHAPNRQGCFCVQRLLPGDHKHRRT